MVTNLSLGGEVETLGSAKPPRAGSIPAQDSRIKIILMIFIRESWTKKRLKSLPRFGCITIRPAQVVESVDTKDLKSFAY